MKVHQILFIATIAALCLCLFGIVGVATGLETPKMMLDCLPTIVFVLAGSTAVSWTIGTIARAVL